MNIYFKTQKQCLLCLFTLEIKSSEQHYFFFNEQENFNKKLLYESTSYCYKLYHVNSDEVLKEDHHWLEIGTSFSLIKNHGKILLNALSKLWGFMPEGIHYSGANPFNKTNFSNKYSFVTFYGGSFNPWHDGHQECLNKSKAENIIVIPDFNPWKKKNENDICAYKTFVEIYYNIKDTSYSLYPGFWGRETSNPTIDWINEVDVLNKALIMGDDNFTKIFKWKDSNKLLKSLERIYIISRIHARDDYLQVKSEIENKKIMIELIYIEENSFKHISSTKIREKLK